MSSVLAGALGMAVGSGPRRPGDDGYDFRDNEYLIAEWSTGHRLVRLLEEEWWRTDPLERRELVDLNQMFRGGSDPHSVTLLVYDAKDRLCFGVVVQGAARDETLLPKLVLSFDFNHMHRLKAESAEQGIALWVMDLLIDIGDLDHEELIRASVPMEVSERLVELFRKHSMHDRLEDMADNWERSTGRSGIDFFERAMDQVADDLVYMLNNEVIQPRLSSAKSFRGRVYWRGHIVGLQLEPGVNPDYPDTVVWWVRWGSRSPNGSITGVRPKDRIPAIGADHGDLFGLLEYLDLYTTDIQAWLDRRILEPSIVHADISEFWPLLGEPFPWLWSQKGFIDYIEEQEG